MAHRINIILSDEVWQGLQSLPRGERSRVANRALARELLRSRRIGAAKALDEFSRKLPAATGAAEGWIREDRDSH